MRFSLLQDLKTRMPDLRGRLRSDVPLSALTWFRLGGPSDVLFAPADEADLVYFFSYLPSDISVTVIGSGSNLLVRDGGILGVVVKLAGGFSAIEIEEGYRLRVGAGAPDVRVAVIAARSGIAGFSFLRGIPGSIGGALRMNAGAYGVEMKDVLINARAVMRSGEIVTFSNEEMAFGYRHSNVPEDITFTEALLQGRQGVTEDILHEMDEICNARSSSQPVLQRSGGSTFRNPSGYSAWRLIDEAGCRGLKLGGAQVSELHCNFFLNNGEATSYDIECLGEHVRERVKETSGIELEWEIRRIGVAK
ncbi:MAG: UDP-N-acetylmuramate dehydrogenase [Alphaproteobacteria bacterium]|nr:UDP-N-acetylmuramate dehydrogenase [Alphaproteobacteria bacterium]